jgi:hypothetical protein
MKIFDKASMSKAAILSLLAISILCLPVMAQESRNESHTIWNWIDDGWKKSIDIRGKAEFTDDYSDIRDVSVGGSVRIEETRGGTTRRLDVVRGADGQLQRT